MRRMRRCGRVGRPKCGCATLRATRSGQRHRTAGTLRVAARGTRKQARAHGDHRIGSRGTASRTPSTDTIESNPLQVSGQEAHSLLPCTASWSELYAFSILLCWKMAMEVPQCERFQTLWLRLFLRCGAGKRHAPIDSRPEIKAAG